MLSDISNVMGLVDLATVDAVLSHYQCSLGGQSRCWLSTTLVSTFLPLLSLSLSPLPLAIRNDDWKIYNQSVMKERHLLILLAFV